MSYVYDKLMRLSGIRKIDVPELGLGMLDCIGKALRGEDENPFPHLDRHESPLELWFYEILKRVNTDPSSEFYYKKWVGEE